MMRVVDCRKGQLNITVGSLLRDALLTRLPEWLSRIFRRRLGMRIPDYVFMVHTRTLDDVYAAFPLMKQLVRWVPERWVLRVLEFLGSATVYSMDWPEWNLYGMVVSTLHLPQEFFGHRRKTMRIASSNFRLIHRLGVRDGVVALAGWWPSATRLGRSLLPLIDPQSCMRITTGHTATLFSLERTTLAVLDAIGMPLSSARIAVLGVGHMGSAYARLFNGKCAKLGLFDRNVHKAEKLGQELNLRADSSQVFVYHPASSNSEVIDAAIVDPDDQMIAGFLAQFDVAICTTTNTQHIIHDVRHLRNCIIIDDSRPEAFPRVYDPERGVVVLEGGLIRLPGIQIGHDNGWGANSEEVFGCMAEGALLAILPQNAMAPTIGEIDPAQYHRLSMACDRLGVTEGRLCCGSRVMTPAMLRALAPMEASGLPEAAAYALTADWC